MNTAIERMGTLWRQALEIWASGGWGMIAIAVVALVLFSLGVNIHFRLSETGFQRVDERTWRKWIEAPAERRGPIGAVLDFVCNAANVKDAVTRFDELRSVETKPFARDLTVMKVCVSAAPLVGLLGTVTGMLATFSALSSGSGGDQTMGMIAKGISEALVTTETGLVVALPGLFFQYQLGRRFERYKVFLEQVEVACTQSIHRRDRRESVLLSH